METKEKSFLQKPENIAGLVIGGIVLAGMGWGLFVLLPLLLILATNIILLGAMTAFIVLVGAFLVEQRTLIKYAWRSAMRAIAGLVVQMDPIGIMKTYVESLQQSLGNMNEQIGNLRGAMRKLKDKIDRNQVAYDQAMKTGREAHQTGNANVFQLQSREAQRRENSNKLLIGSFQRMEILYRTLQRYQEKAKFMIQDLQSEIETKSADREAMKMVSSAMASAQSIIDGKPDERALFEMALEATTNEYSQQLGEIENFIDLSKGALESSDLENGVFQKDMLDKISAWEKADSKVLGQDKHEILSISYNPTIPLNLDAHEKVAVER